MYNDYGYGYTTTAASTSAGIVIAYFVIMLAISILMLVSYWKIFVKAGKPGWASIVPVYNFIVKCEIAEKPWWYVLLLLIPFANIYASVTVINGIVKKLGKGTGYTVGAIFLPVIFIPMLAFGKNDIMLDSISSDEANTVQDNFSNVSNNTSNIGYQAPVFSEPTSTLNTNPVQENVAPTFDDVVPNQNIQPTNSNINNQPIQENIAPAFDNTLNQNQGNMPQNTQINNTMENVNTTTFTQPIAHDTSVNSFMQPAQANMVDSNVQNNNSMSANQPNVEPNIQNTFAQPVSSNTEPNVQSNYMQQENGMQNVSDLNVNNLNNQVDSMMSNNVNINASVQNNDAANNFNVNEQQGINNTTSTIQNDSHTSIWSNNNQNNGQI